MRPLSGLLAALPAAGVLAGAHDFRPVRRSSHSAGIGPQPKIPDTAGNATSRSAPKFKPLDGFVEAKEGGLWVEGRNFGFRSMNAPNLMGGTSEFENADSFEVFAALGVPATRTYILVSVENDQFPGGNVWASESMIYSWNATTDDWNYNEDYLVIVDKMLAQAAEYGVKVIIPFVNQDYGEANDWFGTITDLIRHRYNISSYEQANLRHDWFADPEMARVFKKIVTKALTRTNTVNGRVWGKDDTVLAWETGNEMNHGVYNASNYTLTYFKRPAPANWTIDIAQHIKSLAPNTLVMDGSFSRICNDTTGTCESMTKAWPKESLESPYIDLFSYHFYGDGEIKWFKQFAERVAQFNKTFIIGEHGFYSTPEVFQQAWNNISMIPCAAAALWSMRPHAESSGFLTHSEGSGVYSYHFPGWNQSPAPDFQKGERHISHQTYRHSFKAVGRDVPPFPIPGAPVLSDASNATFGPGVTWRGAAWADAYELWAASIDAPYFQLVGPRLLDNVDEGALFVPVHPSDAGVNITFNAPAKIISSQPDHIDWHDPSEGGITGSSVDDLHQGADAKPKKRSEVVTAKELEWMERRSNITLGAGSWYILRALSVHENIPGQFSNVVFVASNHTHTAS